MTVYEIKKKMLEWEDFFGGDIMYTQEIEEAKTKKDLANILDMYCSHLDDLGNDAVRHCENFKYRLGLGG